MSPESLCDIGRRSASAASRQFVDRAAESAVPECSPLELPEAVGEDTDEVGGHRLDVPSCTQARCGEGILVEGVDEVGDPAPLGGHGAEDLFAFDAGTS